MSNVKAPGEEPRRPGGALKIKSSKPKTEIPKSLDPETSSGPGSGCQKKEANMLVVMLNLGLMEIRLVSASGYSQRDFQV